MTKDELILITKLFRKIIKEELSTMKKEILSELKKSDRPIINEEKSIERKFLEKIDRKPKIQPSFKNSALNEIFSMVEPLQEDVSTTVSVLDVEPQNENTEKVMAAMFNKDYSKMFGGKK